MPRDATTTRDRLLDAAAHEFAEQGVWNASLIEVTRRAGQGNRAALRYHFGTREDVLCAVLERHVEFLAQREGELLAKARRTPDDDVGAVREGLLRAGGERGARGSLATRRRARCGWWGGRRLPAPRGGARGGGPRPLPPRAGVGARPHR